VKSAAVALRTINPGISGSMRRRATINSAGLTLPSGDVDAVASPVGTGVGAWATKVPLPTVCVMSPRSRKPASTRRTAPREAPKRSLSSRSAGSFTPTPSAPLPMPSRR
jgi:hypothetical protein